MAKHIERWYFSGSGGQDPLTLLNTELTRYAHHRLRIVSIETVHTDTPSYVAYVVWVEVD